MYLNNNEELERLKFFNENLSLLQNFIDGSGVRNILDGRDLSPLLSPETVEYANENNVRLFFNLFRWVVGG